jgi:hypothetical protein
VVAAFGFNRNRNTRRGSSTVVTGVALIGMVGADVMSVLRPPGDASPGLGLSSGTT